MWFTKKNIDIAVKKEETETDKVTSKESENKPSTVEWIWIDGYKATKSNMTCRNYQYELGRLETIPNDADIEECRLGFHLCRDLKDVFTYYGIGNNHRFFKVRALVRRSDYERYGKDTIEYEEYKNNNHGRYSRFFGNRTVDQLVARAIIFDQELTPDEILKDRIDCSTWSDEHKILALAIGIDEANKYIKAKNLITLGFSMPIAQFIVESGKYSAAIAIASQPDLSMDMKCWLIFK